MDGRHARIYIRMRALCCQTWGCSPVEFEEMAEANKVAVEDVIETMMLRASEPFGVNPLAFVYREKDLERRRKLEEAKALVMQLRAESDPERREKLMRRLDEVNR